MSIHRHLLRAAFCASLSLPLLFSAGCSDDGTVTTGSSTNLAKGNWQFSSGASAAAKLSSLSGELSTEGNTTSGTLHSQSANACIAPGTAFQVTGTITSENNLILSGPVAGGNITITGTLAPDGKSLSNASYNVTGGSCAFAQTAKATAQAFAAITGNYAGNFADTDGQVAQVTANFAQSTTPDANGNFTLAGTATVSNNPCFPSTVPVSNTQVTGGTFTFTYAANGNSVTAQGTFSSDASTLSVTRWISSGTCGADTGVASTMTRQGS